MPVYIVRDERYRLAAVKLSVVYSDGT